MSDGLRTEIVAEWEPGTFLENLAPTSGGSWLVTIPSHRRIDRVDRDGHTEVFAEPDRMPTGIVAENGGALVLTGTIGSRDWQLVRVDRGHCQAVCELPDLLFGNGMQRVGGHLLAMDSALGLALNIARALLLRCSTTEHDLTAVAANLTADDFAVHPDGRIFLATHYGNSVLQLDPDGRRIELAGQAHGLMGSTAVALDPGDPDVLYVTTTGGMRGVHDRNAQPARLMRLRPASGGAT